MSASASPAELRDAIAEVLWAKTKEYETPGVCDSLGVPPLPENAIIPGPSKRVYVRTRLSGLPRNGLLEIVRKIRDEYGATELDQYIGGVGIVGVDGELKNLIFAADGPKPRIVLRDAVNNVIEIVENADHCLVYDRPLGPDGLSCQHLVDWWRVTHAADAANDLDAGRHLHRRLNGSLQSPPEKLLFNTYAKRYGAPDGFDLPALVPQVYLHYDPYTKAELGPEGQVLSRQRMDFLMLLPDQSRIVIEVDGQQHYSSGSQNQKPDPRRYAEMVREDRTLRLSGYEVYRFGGAELRGASGVRAVNNFFDALLARHG
jgi:hypothetical protein